MFTYYYKKFNGLFSESVKELCRASRSFEQSIGDIYDFHTVISELMENSQDGQCSLITREYAPIEHHHIYIGGSWRFSSGYYQTRSGLTFGWQGLPVNDEYKDAGFPGYVSFYLWVAHPGGIFPSRSTLGTALYSNGFSPIDFLPSGIIQEGFHSTDITVGDIVEIKNIPEGTYSEGTLLPASLTGMCTKVIEIPRSGGVDVDITDPSDNCLYNIPIELLSKILKPTAFN